MADGFTDDNTTANIIDSTVDVMDGLINSMERMAESEGSAMILLKLQAEALDDDIEDMVQEFEVAQMEGKNVVTRAREFTASLAGYRDHLRRGVRLQAIADRYDEVHESRSELDATDREQR